MTEAERAMEIVEQARRRPAADRPAFVRARCRGDDALEQRVLTMLDEHTPAPTIDVPPPPMQDAASAPPALGAATTPPAPERIGPYRILEPLGEGGMGVVYLAEQTAPVRRRVALKLMKPHLASREIVARFHAERQALALMSHPTIAGILEGGVAEGRPYFVMEYVPGVPITEYCDRARLAVPDRLRLFIDVCQGVQHAHQKGIIHRDLKPTNVLVTEHHGEPVPKIIDFGIAKAVGGELGDQTFHTELGRLIGTPEYMSPEQAALTQLDVDTRTDVYSLGAILYELLVGTRIFDSLRAASPVAMQRAICEQEPERPSARLVQLDGSDAAEIARRRSADVDGLARMIRDDLDWITLKALEKERTRRYASASELAADLERHLANQTVAARPPSVTYRARKFVRRNRLAVVAATTIVVTLAAAALLTSIFAVAEARQRRAAERAGAVAARERDVALSVMQFLTDDLLAAAQPSNDPDRGPDVTMRQVLDAASRSIASASRPGGRFHDRPLVEARIRDTLASTYRRLGLLDAAEDHAERAVALRREHLGPAHVETLEAMLELGALYENQQRYAEADRYLRGLLEAWRARDPADPLAVASVETSLGNVRARLGREADAERLYRAALATREDLLGPSDPQTLAVRANLGALLFTLRRYDEAEPHLVECATVEAGTLGEDHPSTLLTKNSLAVLYAETGRADDADRLMREVLQGSERTYGGDHPVTLIAMTNLARFYVSGGQLERAEPIARDAAERCREKLGASHSTTANALGTLCTIYEQQDRGDEAEACRRTWLAALVTAARRPDATPDVLNWLAWELISTGYEALRDPATSVELARRAARLTAHQDPTILDTLARGLHAAGDVPGALVQQRMALALVADDDPQRGEYEAFLAQLEADAATDAGREAPSAGGDEAGEPPPGPPTNVP